MTLTLSRAATLRPRAEAAVDAHYGALIAAEIGPLGALHALKRAQAAAGRGALLDGDRDAVLARSAEQDERLAALDRQRRALKAAIRSAETAAGIRAALEQAGVGL